MTATDRYHICVKSIQQAATVQAQTPADTQSQYECLTECKVFFIKFVISELDLIKFVISEVFRRKEVKQRNELTRPSNGLGSKKIIFFSLYQFLSMYYLTHVQFQKSIINS